MLFGSLVYHSTNLFSRKGKNNMAKQVVVITGGSSGIGLATAQKFVQSGANVALLGRDKSKLEKAQAILKTAFVMAGDVCKIADLDAFYGAIQKQWGKIDVVVANAGVAAMREVQEVDESFFDEIVNTNYKGVFFTVQRALPYLNLPASVVLISSLAAHIGWPAHSVYSSTKAAVRQLASNFSTDLIKKGIRVNSISPGFVDTPIFDSTKQSNPDAIHKLSEQIPLGRFATPEEIADAIFFVAHSPYMVGSDLLIDGGVRGVF
jgi:NAD(P)-dependent dehydrogenase (short-subunit alcohol dehydrogenase family)